MKYRPLFCHRSLSRHQSGLALVLTLIVLVAMTLASVGMVRSIDTAVLVAGNMAFRQGTVASGAARTSSTEHSPGSDFISQ